MKDDDVLPIAHEILAESKLVRDKVELSKSNNSSKPLTSIPVNKEKSPSKSPCIAEAFAAARNARKCKVILGGARGDQNERLDAANGSKSAKEKDSVVVVGDTNALKKARWRAPKVHCPLQTIFCQTKKDFNNHYGLDTEGKDPRLLKDSDVLEGDWLSVFSHSRDTSSYRVKCSSIRPEQYEDLLIFYMKVYQKHPTNMEANVSFARAYVLQFSPRAVKAGRSVQFAWAIVGEEHNNDLKKSGHFHMHYLRWKVINGAGDSIVGIVNVKEPNIELTPPPPIAPLASHILSVQLTDDQNKEGKLRTLIEDVQCRLTVAKDEHATCLKKLEAGKVQQLSDEKFGKALSLLDEQISATKLKLASAAEDEPVKRIQLASQLEAPGVNAGSAWSRII
ncbi:hypothetical protein L7F22_040713 [Adiantum nelumboides]|nr:hypothetical protein [Adiantum nelumboides]